mmetsp:Transcript_1594/g.4555  ORF Transcript_1594/g.4555 Transcript_1594/m.4555 type:complete len:456 (+) Transcript_1594:338-1705(+)
MPKHLRAGGRPRDSDVRPRWSPRGDAHCNDHDVRLCDAPVDAVDAGRLGIPRSAAPRAAGRAGQGEALPSQAAEGWDPQPRGAAREAPRLLPARGEGRRGLTGAAASDREPLAGGRDARRAQRGGPGRGRPASRRRHLLGSPGMCCALTDQRRVHRDRQSQPRHSLHPAGAERLLRVGGAAALRQAGLVREGAPRAPPPGGGGQVPGVPRPLERGEEHGRGQLEGVEGAGAGRGHAGLALEAPGAPRLEGLGAQGREGAALAVARAAVAAGGRARCRGAAPGAREPERRRGGPAEPRGALPRLRAGAQGAAPGGHRPRGPGAPRGGACGAHGVGRRDQRLRLRRERGQQQRGRPPAGVALGLAAAEGEEGQGHGQAVRGSLGEALQDGGGGPQGRGRGAAVGEYVEPLEGALRGAARREGARPRSHSGRMRRSPPVWHMQEARAPTPRVVLGRGV